MKGFAIPMDLSDILGGASEERKRSGNGYDVSLDHEIQIERLREAAEPYTDAKDNGPRFRVGDLVQPMKQFGIKGCGAPHIVVEVLKGAQPLFSSDNPSSLHNGNRLDMRVLVMLDNDTIVPFWVESWQYEAYTVV